MAPNREVRGVDLCLSANRSAGMGAGCGVGSGPQVDVFGLNKWILSLCFFLDVTAKLFFCGDEVLFCF